MRFLKMLPGTAAPVENPVWIEKVESVTSDQTGIFYPLVKRGTYVSQGARIGYVTDYVGKIILDARAPASGVVTFIRAVPSMTKGETIASIGVVAQRAP
jgi:predicted deacylase